jgi:anti-sigma B factor antagonist
MKIHTELVQKICIVTCEGGRFDASFAPKFLSSMQYLTRKGYLDVILDLSSVVFLDSTGLGAIVRCLKDIGDRGQMVLCGVNPKVQSLLKMTRLEDIFTITEDRDNAFVLARAQVVRRSSSAAAVKKPEPVESSSPVFDDSLLSSLKMEDEDAVHEVDSSERRRHRRIPQQQIVDEELFFSCLSCSSGRRVSGAVLDISPSGLLFSAPGELAEKDEFIIEGNIGKSFKLREHAIIRNREGLHYGFEFIKPSKETTSFLHQLTGAVILTPKATGRVIK